MAQQRDGMNQHKALASGRAVTGLKKGGHVETKEKESFSFQKREGAKGERAEMKRGGAAKCGKCGMAHGGRCK